MSHLTQEQLHNLQQKLMDRKVELERRMVNNDQHGLGESERDMTGELSHIDNHPGDVGTEVFERGKDLALQDRVDQELQRVIFSLEAIHHDRYGVCLTCGQPIPYERLEVIPDTQYCVEHTPRERVSRDRPVEEDVLAPAFGKSSMDEHEYAAFDGEDAWQIVESWGTPIPRLWRKVTKLTAITKWISKMATIKAGSWRCTKTSLPPISMARKCLSYAVPNMSIT